MTQKGETKEEKDEEEAPVEMLNPVAEMEEVVEKANAKAEEQHRFDKESFESRMEAKQRDRVEEEKARTGAVAEKQPLLFEKEEVNFNDSGASFVDLTKEEKSRDLQETISVLMKRHREEMRDSIEADIKEAREVFNEALNASMDEAVSKVRAELELSMMRNVEDVARVAKENYHMRRDQEDEETSSSLQSFVADEILAAAADKSKGERLRATKKTIALVTTEKDRDMDEAVEREITECGQGLDRAVSDERQIVEAEAAYDRKRVVEEAVSDLRESHDSELSNAVGRYTVEKEEADAARPNWEVAYSVSGGGK